jgi:hypothetical protein
MIKGIKYYSFMWGGGYGEAGLAYMQCLINMGVDLTWSPLIWSRWGAVPWRLLPEKMRPSKKEIEEGLEGRADLMEYFEKDIAYDTVFLHSVPEIWPKLVEADKVNIGYSVWETDNLPPHWPALLNKVDHLCVPCEFNRALFTLDQGPQVSVVPHVVRTSSYKCTAENIQNFKRKYDIADNVYIFYIIAAWEPRKAMKETLQAYMQAFDADEDVCLLIKTDKEGWVGRLGKRVSVEQLVENIVSEYPRPAKVILIAEQISELSLQLIHEIGDCFFSLTHSEGWGLGAFDAAASGNSVIITAWGGQMDYLPLDSCYHVSYKLDFIEKTAGWVSYDKIQKWAYADIEDASMQLRYCYQNKKEAKARGLQLQSFVNSRFSTEKVSSSLLRAIDYANSE